ncbi:hypothetical protein EYC84_005635 [Monilinia fructicola]|uniref:Uncharacterized protein n=1 Tax=Monilinia fructicola TaxID=38448 RepID=A0A5M9K018_MONFR|nr:hypothetical protein EYC84_005635 [Monilinia fructicola]
MGRIFPNVVAIQTANGRLNSFDREEAVEVGEMLSERITGMLGASKSYQRDLGWRPVEEEDNQRKGTRWDGRIDGRMDGWMDGWMEDGWMMDAV